MALAGERERPFYWSEVILRAYRANPFFELLEGIFERVGGENLRDSRLGGH
jgi:hypothetical protein